MERELKIVLEKYCQENKSDIEEEINLLKKYSDSEEEENEQNSNISRDEFLKKKYIAQAQRSLTEEFDNQEYSVCSGAAGAHQDPAEQQEKQISDGRDHC